MAKKLETVMGPAQANRIAQAIVDDLFVNGAGERADRLVLWVDSSERNLGGWAQVVVFDRIVKLLVEQAK